MKTIILAGGLGTRLRGAIGNIPKPMARIGGIPLLERTVKWLTSYGLNEIYIHVFHRAETVIEHFGSGQAWGAQLNFRTLPLKGSGTVVKEIAHEFPGPALIVYGDLFTNVDLHMLFEYHARNKSPATIGLYRPENIKECGIVETDDLGRIKGFVEKPEKALEENALANSGIYILDRNFLEWMPDISFMDFGRQVFPQAVAAGWRMHGFEFSSESVLIDIGTPVNYSRAQEPDLLRRWQEHMNQLVTMTAPVADAARESLITGTA